MLFTLHFFFELYGDHRDLHVLTHSFPTRRSSDLDTRDGKDYSANATYEIDSESTDFRISGFYVRTDRSETERSFEYDDPTAITGPLPAGNQIGRAHV